MIRRHHNRSGIYGALLLLVLSGATALVAQEVELNPGAVEGVIQIGAEPINNAWIYGYSDALNAQLSVSANPPSTPLSYSLTVQVEAGSSRTWSVYAQVRTDSYRDYLRFPTQSVLVTDGTPGTADFVVADPCYIEGSITVNGGTLGSVQIYAWDSGGQYARTNSADSTGFYRFPVIPSSSIRVDPQITLGSGTRVFPDDVDNVNCPAGGTATLDFVVDAPSASISGSIDYAGPLSVDRYRVWVNGPANKTIYLYPPFGVDNSTAYSVDDLPDGTYYQYTEAYLDNYNSLIRFPQRSYSSAFTPPDRPEIVSGSTPVVDISDVQSFITGNVEFVGSVTGISSGYAYAYGDYQSETRNGYGRSRIEAASGDYSIPLTEGPWSPYQFYFNFYRPLADPDGYLSQNLWYTDYGMVNNPISVPSGGSVSVDHTLAMGSVTIKFSITAGVFSNPRLNGSCRFYDENGALLHYYSFNSYSSGQSNVTTGQVTFVGMEGTCDYVRAQAYVDGSLTTFGEISVEVIPGVEQEIDLGGPSLTVDVEPGLCIDADEILVTGTATDDIGVVSITVNGLAATFGPTGNPSDPNEVAFSVTVPLPVKGPNEIETVATDASGKTGTDTRTVYNDSGPPALSFTPADGTVVSLPVTSVTVVGTTSDDAGIQSVTVDGTEVAVDAGGGFSTDVTLDQCLGSYPCDTFITVVSTDISQKSTTVTHKVTLIDNQPPIAEAGGPYDVDEGSSVVLMGGGSDPENGPLLYAWDLDDDGTFETAGQNVTFSAAALDGPSAYTVGLLVTDDGGLTHIDTATVNVLNVAPDVGDITAPLAPIDVMLPVNVSAAFTDPGVADTHVAVWDWGDGSQCDTSVDVDCSLTEANGVGSTDSAHTYAGAGVYTITVTITDDDGDSDQSVFQFVVVYDPSAGFVTGGGWIDSPPGAYAADPTLTGKANFGFVAKYKKGQSSPTGSTEFQFQAGGLNFHSSSYQWLVVAGYKAQFKGAGTINGAGNYGFLITAIDEKLTPSTDTDGFRIKIWDLAAGGGVIYDNKMGASEAGEEATELGGGSIVIHSGGGGKS